MDIVSLEKPLVSLIVLTYNQESYVTDAVQSALAQTYHPLQVIVSDDCSPDGTAKKAQQAVKNYRGPHKVDLNVNISNLGLAGNVNRAVSISKGEFVIMQGGDDLSVPDRTSKLVDRWSNKKNPVDLVCSYFEEIDEHGVSSGYIKKEVVFVPSIAKDASTWRCGATGACAGYDRRLFDNFGALIPDVISEDWVLSFRAWLGRGIALVEEPLVKHRAHDQSISVMMKHLSRNTDRLARFGRRKRMQAGELAIAMEWLRAWELMRPSDRGEAYRSLVRLVSLRAAQYEAFEAPLRSLPRIAARVCRNGGVYVAAKLLFRHVSKLY